MTIPVSTIVQINPSVLPAGGNPPVLTGVFLSQNLLVPTNQVLTFTSAAAVGEYFGTASQEYILANTIYFQGYEDSFIIPGALIIAPYNLADRSAFLQSGFLTGLTLTELQALSGQFTIDVDGNVLNTGALSLSAATSFSNAATIIETALNTPTPYVTVTWDSINNTFLFTSMTTGLTSTITYATDIGLSTLAASLALTQITGAVLSQGAIADTPTTAIANLVLNTQAWCSVTTLWEPIQSDKLLFAAAINALANKYMYVCWDTDAQTIIANSTLTTSYLIKQAAYNNTVLISGSAADAIAEGTTLAAATLNTAVFILDFVASVDFQEPNGRTTAAFRSLAGLLPTVLNPVSAANLLINGYNFYGAYANATNSFVFFYDGAISGIFKWIDSFINQVYLNDQMQTTLMETLLAIPSLPYNAVGYSQIALSLQTDIQDALSFGTIRTGVTLDSLQINTVNAEAGLDLTNTLFTQGYYLQVLDPGAIARANRQSPIVNFWYTDGQSIQKITMQSIDIL